jgi:hypothetical protein
LTTVAFDNEPRLDPLDRAIAWTENPPDPAARVFLAAAMDVDREWWGTGDPGGDPLVLDGVYAIVCGRRVPALVSGSLARVGLPARLGYCLPWAIVACARLLRQPGATSVALILGTAFSVHQSWTEYQQDGRWYVSDLTLDDGSPFDRDAYYRDLHAVVGTRVPIPDRAALDHVIELIQAGALERPRAESGPSAAIAAEQERTSWASSPG